LILGWTFPVVFFCYSLYFAFAQGRLRGVYVVFVLLVCFFRISVGSGGGVCGRSGGGRGRGVCCGGGGGCVMGFGVSGAVVGVAGGGGGGG